MSSLRALRDFEHFGSEGQSVGRVVEKWIRGDFHFVEEDVLARGVQADGHGVADEVDFVAARGELDAQLGSYDSRAAISRIASDSDFHLRLGDELFLQWAIKFR